MTRTSGGWTLLLAAVLAVSSGVALWRGITGHSSMRAAIAFETSAAGAATARRDAANLAATHNAPRDPGWPNLFGPTHDSVAHESAVHIPAWGPAGPAVLWRAPCGTGYSSPIVCNDRLILLHRVAEEEVVECFDAVHGERLWAQRYPTSFVCGSHYTSGPYSTPATDGESVFTLGAQGQLHCWSLSDGVPRWSRDLRTEFDVPEDIFGVGHSPLLWGNRLILNVGGRAPGSGVIAFDPGNGEILWRSTSAGAAFATPTPARMHGRDWLFVLTRQGLSLLDPSSGREYWALPFEPRIPDSANAVTPLVVGNRVLISTWGVGTTVLQIDASGDYEVLWESRRNLTSQYTPLVAVRDCVIGVHALDNSLRCMELESGTIRWRWKSELGNSRPIRVGEQLILFGEYGHLGLISCRTDELIELCSTRDGLFSGTSRCFSAPAYAAGRLYVRSESEVQCLDFASR